MELERLIMPWKRIGAVAEGPIPGDLGLRVSRAAGIGHGFDRRGCHIRRFFWFTVEENLPCSPIMGTYAFSINLLIDLLHLHQVGEIHFQHL